MESSEKLQWSTSFYSFKFRIKAVFSEENYVHHNHKLSQQACLNTSLYGPLLCHNDTG